MRLRTLEPYGLLKNGLIASYASLQSDDESQLVVIGGGITGALVSYFLVQNNYKVILIDKRDIGLGSTAANTSMLQYEIDVPLYKLIEKIGEKGADECYHSGIGAIHDLCQLIKEKKIDCEFDYRKSLYISRTEKDSAWLKKEYEARKKCGLGVEWLNRKTVLDQYGIKCFGAILSDTAGVVDAYKLTHKLIEISVKAGMKVFDQTEAGNIEFKNNQSIIHTTAGHKLTCEKIIFCTGYETVKLLKEPICNLHYTFACISEQQAKYKKTLDDVLVWDTATPYFYMRTTDDGRVLIGGEDIDFNIPILQNTVGKIKQKKLIKLLSRIAPEIEFEEDFSWGGTFGSTNDGLPYIGKSPEHDHALFALGYGGNGIVFSVQAMEIIHDLLEGKDHPLAHWYRFGR